MGSLHNWSPLSRYFAFLRCLGRVDLSLYPLSIYAFFLAAQLLSRYVAHGIPVFTSSRVQISLLLALMSPPSTTLSHCELRTYTQLERSVETYV